MSSVAGGDLAGDDELRPSTALQLNKDRVIAAISRFNLSNPKVFGSVARGEDDEASDLDILVEPGKGVTFFDLSRLESELQSILGCRVEVTTPKGLSVKAALNAAHDLRELA
ncbi:MAG TPA: nucleotidyltransferase domain-containing protein [Methylocystis sp.]|nr:nucleotidyltransferase domain-containing protein [Methylocystis sp.]